MSVLYADTSALATAYLHDEIEHPRYRALLLAGTNVVLTSALTRVEIASAVRPLVAHGRPRAARAVLERFDAHCSGGPVTLLAFAADSVLLRAYDIVLAHRVRTLDAIHLAVALDASEDEPEVAFVTRDARQAAAAASLGLAVG